MNQKISSGQSMAISVALIFAMFPGFANSLILSQSKNASLLAVLIGFILGIIPALTIAYISKKINTDFFSFTKEKFKFLAYPIIIIILIFSLLITSISSWVSIDFIISQFLTRSSYYLIAILISVVSAIVINKGIEPLSRTVFMLFIMSVSIIIILLMTIAPYIELDNLKPYIDTSYKNIIKSSISYITISICPLFFILNLKGITKDKDNFARKILVGYTVATFLIFVLLFFIISVYGIELGSLLTYPIYGLFKKVQIFGFVERVENFASIFLITASFSQIAYLTYFMKDNISLIFKIKNSKKRALLTYALSIIIPIVSIFLFKTFELSLYIKYIPIIFCLFFIIILIYFIRCLFIKN